MNNVIRFLPVILSILVAIYATYTARSHRMPAPKNVSQKMQHNLQMMLFDNGISSGRVSYSIKYNYIPFQPHMLVFAIEDGIQTAAKYKVLISRRNKEIWLSLRIPDEPIYQKIISDFMKSGWV